MLRETYPATTNSFASAIGLGYFFASSKLFLWKSSDRAEKILPVGAPREEESYGRFSRRSRFRTSPLSPRTRANRFAAEILIPRGLMAEFVQSEPSLESIRSIAQLCGTSLTASAVRLIALTPHRAAVVWSQNQKILWSKLSEGFVRWIRKGEVRENSFAAQCYRKQSVPDQLAPVPASAWLHGKGLREGAQIWEQSVGLKRYGAVLSLLVIIEAVEKGK